MQSVYTMAQLTTHVLDTAQGRPAAGVRITVYAERGGNWEQVAAAATNADGRCERPLLQGAALQPGRYRLVFEVGAYFRDGGQPLAEPPFLDRVPIEFGVADPAAHYHVPLLLTPWSYTTYRGS